MAYFNYHARAQNLIKTGHCVSAELTEEHGDIRPALMLYFDNHPPMPVRPHMFFVYFEMLKLHGVTVADVRIKNTQADGTDLTR